MKANADFSSMPPSAHSFARKIKLDWQNCLQTETESTAELLKYPEIEAVLYEHHINRERLEPIQENMLFWVLLPGLILSLLPSSTLIVLILSLCFYRHHIKRHAYTILDTIESSCALLRS